MAILRAANRRELVAALLNAEVGDTVVVPTELLQDLDEEAMRRLSQGKHMTIVISDAPPDIAGYHN